MSKGRCFTIKVTILRLQLEKKILKAGHPFFFNETVSFSVFLKPLHFWGHTESEGGCVLTGGGNAEDQEEDWGFTEAQVCVRSLSP